MLILGIETSCDETGMSVIRIKREIEILSNVVSSQVKLHAKYGGIYPFLAKREHQKNLPIVFKKAIKNIAISEINLVAVIVGPGLEPCLWTGVNFAKKLAKKLRKPLIPINHLEAHILINFLNFKKIPLPATCLVISGGHTILFSMKKIGKYQLIGETRDDAAGECLDKVARVLGLGYPGGPAIALVAQQRKTGKFKIKLPRPMIYHKNYDFSFSGLKTAVLYDFKGRKTKIRKSKEYIREMAKEIQQSVIDVLVYKTLKAAKEFKAKSIILGGGVAANEELRKQFRIKTKKETKGIRFFVPEAKFCTDNGLMTAFTALFYSKKKFKKTTVNANLKI